MGEVRKGQGNAYETHSSRHVELYGNFSLHDEGVHAKEVLAWIDGKLCIDTLH